MLTLFIRTNEAIRHLRSDVQGVVSFEYVIVVSCLAAAVSLGFGAGAGGGEITATLSSAITAIATKLP